MKGQDSGGRGVLELRPNMGFGLTMIVCFFLALYTSQLKLTLNNEIAV